jgi:hypothetical protein
MKYLHPSVNTIPEIESRYKTADEEIESHIVRIVKEFKGMVNTPETKSSFYNMIDNVNNAIYVNWGIPSVINGNIFKSELTIWDRRKVYEQS